MSNVIMRENTASMFLIRHISTKTDLIVPNVTDFVIAREGKLHHRVQDIWSRRWKRITCLEKLCLLIN